MIQHRYVRKLAVIAALGGSLFLGYGVVFTGDTISSAEALNQEDQSTASVRGIHHPPGRAYINDRPIPTPGVRSIDGSGNNLFDPEMGAAVTKLRRIAEQDYEDGASKPAGGYRPSARVVSNAVASQSESVPNRLGASDWLWQWGQFLDHDIDLTDAHLPQEFFPIPVPAGDLVFDPNSTGRKIIALNRSLYDDTTGWGHGNPRQQINEISAWIDASNVYGSDEERAAALRTNDGTGRLRTSAGNLLPFNDMHDPLPNAGGPSPHLFLADDVRANEQSGLTAVHTLFMREHNRQADAYRGQHPELSSEAIYQKARKIVGAYMQAITYNEFLPALLGARSLPPYRGYNPETDGRIANEFSTAAYRFGHSALNGRLLRLDADGLEISAGHLSLRAAFFAPHRILDEGGIDPLLRGLSFQYAQAVDHLVVDDVRNFLFGQSGDDGIMPGFDLAALNIQRGRDHGLPSYNDMREAMGLSRAASFDVISFNPETRARLAAVYSHVDDVDFWIGGLSEDPLKGSHVGALFHKIISEQFLALRDGDRFWYELTLTPQEKRLVNGTRLSDIIRRNTGIGAEIPNDVFRVPNAGYRAPNK